jgi:hypothetical protein
MSDDKFEVTWEADDGYTGGSRPQTFDIDAFELDDCESVADLRRIFWDCVQADFERRVNAVSEDEDAFIEWAKQKIAERKAKETA